jgi:hypothetical protein
VTIYVSKKPTLADLRNQHYFDLSALAERAGVDISVICRMLHCQPVRGYQAELVLAAFADEFGADYALETVEVVLFPEVSTDDNSSA